MIPKDTKKEKKIYEQVRSSISRPQSAVPTTGTDARKITERPDSPTQTAMRSSFYSMSLLNESEKEEMDDKNQISAQFQEQ